VLVIFEVGGQGQLFDDGQQTREITRRGVTVPMTAVRADAEARARLWPVVVERYAGYGRYQARTAREIPVFVLRPDAAAARGDAPAP
jgi:hypothetical protein